MGSIIREGAGGCKLGVTALKGFYQFKELAVRNHRITI
jgi:hypothetical protein